MSLNAANFLFQLRPRIGGKLCRIYAYDANYTDPQTGHMRIDVEVYHGPDCIFRVGDTYCAVNRWTAIDSDDAKALVLSLVAMKPGDTDAEFFESYTPGQLAFVSAFGEELSMVAFDRFGEP